jgi:hypothetical protein
MEALFTRDYAFVWMIALTLALFWPVRRLILVLYLRRAAREGEPDEATSARLGKRATMTAALLSFVFAALYTNHLFQAGP